MSSPIADFTYRDYEGSLASPRYRWWVIARNTIRQALRNRSFWVFTALGSWYYLIMIVIVFFTEQVAASVPIGGRNPSAQFLGQIVWKDQFLHGFSMGQLVFLIGALLIGAGSIANDNRANALLVYLSKPTSKLDYVFGKWFGVFVPLLIMMAIPTIVYWLWGALSYRDYGFLSRDPWLIVRLLAMMPLAAALHASLVVGISSLFNQGRLAGATYAGIYFITNFFTQLMVIVRMNAIFAHGRGGGGQVDPIVEKLYYASVDGVLIGLAKGVIGTNGGAYFGIQNRQQVAVPAPALWAMLLIVVGLALGALLLAWRRVRAVEVVR